MKTPRVAARTSADELSLAQRSPLARATCTLVDRSSSLLVERESEDALLDRRLLTALSRRSLP